MRQRIAAAVAAVGLVAAMTGLGSIPAMAEETVEETPAVVEETPAEVVEEAVVEETPEVVDESTTEDPVQEAVADETSEESDAEESEAEESTTEESTTAEELAEPEPAAEARVSTLVALVEHIAVPLCHATPPATAAQGWNFITPDDDSVTHAHGHSSHAMDIISAFPGYPGKNLTTMFGAYTGQQILDAECGTPAPPPNPEEEKVTLCHAKPPATAKNGWNEITVGVSEVTGPGGHDTHAMDIIPAFDGFSGQNLDTDFGGVSGAVLLRMGCEQGYVEVPYPPYVNDEYCYDSERWDGSITVSFAGVSGKIEYTIYGPDMFAYVVPESDPTTYLPAGDYLVEAVGINGWTVTGQSTFPVTIGAALNCQCAVDMISTLAELVVVEDHVCAEAEVSVTPASCEAAGGLELGDTLYATWEDPVIEDGHYSVTAVADWGYRFLAGPGVSDDGAEKTFEGDLPPKLTNCGTLPVTGASGSGSLLWLGAIAVLLGIGAVATTQLGARREGMLD